MNRLVKCFNNVVLSSREHMPSINLEHAPKVQIAPAKTAVFNAELEEQESFLNFHLDVGTGESEIEEACHCSASINCREVLNKCNERCKDVPSKCDCGLEFDLPVPLEQHLQEENVWIPELLSHGSLDYLY